MRKNIMDQQLLKYIIIVGENLEGFRGTLSEEKFAEKLGISRSTYRKIVKEKKPLSMESLVTIAENLGINLSDLFITESERTKITYKVKLLIDLFSECIDLKKKKIKER